MKIESVDWLLRLDADELRLSQPMMNRIAKTGVMINYAKGVNPETERQYARPDTMANRKIVILNGLEPTAILALKGGKLVATIQFPESLDG